MTVIDDSDHTTLTVGGNTQSGVHRFTVRQLIPFAALILLIICFAAYNGSRFYTPSNLFVIVQQSVVLAIVAYGMTFVITAGSIDLSVGSLVALTGVITALTAHYNQILAIILALLVGCVAGVINGAVYAYGKIPSFIVTLGMLQVARGLTILLTGGAATPMPRDGILGGIGVIPWIVVTGLVITVLAAIGLQYSVFGRRVKAIGGNERVAVLAGVPVRRVKIGVFALSGVLAAAGGVVLASRMGTGSPTAGMGFELDVIAAVVIGGTPLTGGMGRISGTLIGAIIMVMLSNGLVLMGVGDAVQLIIKGIVLALAVFVSLERAKIGIIK